MRIGFDAKWFFDGPPSGRRIVRGLVEGLTKFIDGDELHLFLDARFECESSSVGIPRSQQHYVWAQNNQLSNLFAVPRVADRAGMDVVVYQNFAAPSLVARHARVPLVHDVIFQESPQYYTGLERLYFAPLRALSKRADRVCTVSNSEKARMVRLGFAEAERIDVVPYGIDEEFRAHRHVAAAEPTRPFVLFVGRLTVRKNVSVLIRAMQHVKTVGLDLVVVGASDRTCEDLPALAQALGVAHRVRFLGPMRDELPALYAAAAVFCFPTHDESFGLPPLEAMASGTPTVVSDIPVLREMYGDAAVYIDPYDECALATAIDFVIGNHDRAEVLRANGRARAASFTWDRAAVLLLASARCAVRERS